MLSEEVPKWHTLNAANARAEGGAAERRFGIQALGSQVSFSVQGLGFPSCPECHISVGTGAVAEWPVPPIVLHRQVDQNLLRSRFFWWVLLTTLAYDL